MSFVSLSKALAPLRKICENIPAGGGDPRVASTLILTKYFGDSSEMSDPSSAWVNVAVLAYLSRGSPATYTMRPSASAVVHETDLHAIPTEAPRLLRGPGLVEARRPDQGERLWGDYVSLGWYTYAGRYRNPPSLLDAIFLVGLRYPDGSMVARWTPAWTGVDLDDQLPTEDRSVSLSDLVDRLEHLEFARAAARYLTIFGLLAEVDEGPLTFSLDNDGRTRQVRVAPKDLSWRGFRAPPQPRAEPQTPIDPTTRVLGDRPIRGHLQRFRFGPGRNRVRWRYVEEYTGRRWYKPLWTVERDFKHTGLANDTLIYQAGK